ncbi:MAG TPA: hypothetical protein VEL74_07110 [Thermoanaerobaculia bacterium]|nr:hypothetical protein [Thermoanaerobaculia bacterium]
MDNALAVLMANIWVLIPLAGIGAGMFNNYLKLRSEQRKLGADNRELEKALAEMQRRQTELLDRVQNLEAIVVSQTWDVVNDRQLSEADRERRLASTVRRELRPADPESANQQRAEQLARRLQA